MWSSVKGGYGPTYPSDHMKKVVSHYTNSMFHKGDVKISFTYKTICMVFFHCLKQ